MVLGTRGCRSSIHITTQVFFKWWQLRLQINTPLSSKFGICVQLLRFLAIHNYCVRLIHEWNPCIVGGTINLARMDNYDESKCLDGSFASCYHRAGKDTNDDCIACVVCLWIWIWIYWESMCVLKEQSGKVFLHSWGSNRHIFAMRKVKRLLCVGIIHREREKCLWHMKPECSILCVKSDDTMCCS